MGIYATPKNCFVKLRAELSGILNIPAVSTAKIVENYEAGKDGQPPPNVLNPIETSAGESLTQACAVANSVVDSALRVNYELPLRTVLGLADPDDPAFFPEIIGAAISIVKWELLAGRTDVRTERDRTDYENALSYLGIRNSDGSIRPLDFTGSGVVLQDSPRGAITGGSRNPNERTDLSRAMREAAETFL